jgi:hypothetical protein
MYKIQSYLRRTIPERSKTLVKSKNSSNYWKYFFVKIGSHESIEVCKKFLCNIFQISFKRVATVLNKILNSKSLNDNRGKHNNIKNSISETILNDIKEFVNLIIKHESHYIKGCDKLYFENSENSLTEIYKKIFV